jgi:hypothetical protein
MTNVIRIGAKTAMVIFSFTVFLFAASSTFDGYTFVFSGSNAYLYGMDKKLVKQWSSLRSNSAGCADLLRDSSILWPSSATNSGWTNQGALQGGRVQIIKWDGTVTWDYTYANASYMPHHDMEPVYYTNDPKEKPNVLLVCYTAWGDKIVELKPTGLNTAEVVWEWNGSDHTCASGTGTDKPELLDKGKGGAGMGKEAAISSSGTRDFDRMHTNNVSFNRTLKQLVLSVKGYNEMMVIDHSTTTAEAKDTTGGQYGKGGNILYRWGMPANYGATGTQQIRGQHCSSWIVDTMLGTNQRLPGAFNMMCIDNGNKRAVEIIPAGTKNGVYPRTAGAAFEPASPLWTYSLSAIQGNEGSVQRLPNGNTIICTGGIGGGMGGSTGRVVEVDTSGTIVWDLTGIPVSTEGIRYAYGYLGGTVATSINQAPVFSTQGIFRTTMNPITGQVSVIMDKDIRNARVSLFSLDGQEVVRYGEIGAGQPINLNDRPSGQYLARIHSGNSITWERLTIRH